MTATALMGLQWGDEGKGKMVDLLAAEVDMVVRCQGGSNAGHTVKVGDQKTVLHLVPSGILAPSVRCLIGHGVVVDPQQLLIEMDALESQGVSLSGRLFLSDRAHVVFPHHKSLDALQESSRKAGKIGTTGRGIGPCYADKASRRGIRVHELLDAETLRLRLEDRLSELRGLHDDVEFDDLETVLRDYLGFAERLRPRVADTGAMVRAAHREGRAIFLEGAQGVLLDIDLGTYPFVTSSSTQIGGLLSGSGLSPFALDRVVGVLKAYTTRVGSGPFPTELECALGQRLRDRGHEYGSTTGRPRRCGWFDALGARFAVETNGVSEIALTKIDVMSGFSTIRVCTGYQLDGVDLPEWPADSALLERVEPVYRDFEGWSEDISEVRHYDALPEALRRYVEGLEELCGARIEMISVGPRREDIIART
ncbi:MAG: adenylosuccinate synthase [Planctomycetes bacterium]|nr:adenylosuccinate synthase [Planctomycetota bacterium]